MPRKARGELAALTGRAYERGPSWPRFRHSWHVSTSMPLPTASRSSVIRMTGWAARLQSANASCCSLTRRRPAYWCILPVLDAINLDIDAPVRMFLSVKPLSPLDARLVKPAIRRWCRRSMVWQTTLLRAQLEKRRPMPESGSASTAKLYGGWVVFGYYVLRRPLASLREWTGW